MDGANIHILIQKNNQDKRKRFRCDCEGLLSRSAYRQINKTALPCEAAGFRASSGPPRGTQNWFWWRWFSLFKIGIAYLLLYC